MLSQLKQVIPSLSHAKTPVSVVPQNRRWHWLIGGLLLVVLAVLIIGGPVVYQALMISRALTRLEANAGQVIEAAKIGEWSRAEIEAGGVERELQSIQGRLSQIGPLGYWSVVSDTTIAGQELLTVSVAAVKTYQEVFQVLEQISPQRNFEQLFAQLGQVDGRREILAAIAAESATFARVNQELIATRQSLAAVETSRFGGPFRDQLIGFNAILTELVGSSELALPLIGQLPTLLGHTQAKNYLFVFQNNTELRPSGGFIGSFGLVTVKDGEITRLQTDDVYNLDKLSEGKMFEPVPAPLLTFNKQRYWYLRDANWSPDWPTSAQQINWFWEKELTNAGLPHVPLDGVIAIDPELIKNLLAVTGPIEVSGLSFDKNNFTQELEQFVEFDYAERGIHHTDRKDIIGPLAVKLIAQLQQLPTERMLEVWQAIKKSSDEKHVLAYFNDERLQQYFSDQNWNGRVARVRGDYLMLVDANLAALKTDQAMDRSLDYRLWLNDKKELEGQLTITYQHTGPTVTDYITRYRTYSRLYLPAGTWIYNATVEDVTNQSQEDITSELTFSQDLDKQVAAYFLVVEPGETKTITFHYRLPGHIADQYHQGLYTLLVQKQPGTIGHDLKIALDFNQSISAYQADSWPTSVTGRQLEWQTTLARDHNFTVKF